MCKTKTSPWKAILYKLEQAAIIPERRNAYVYTALKLFVRTTSASGTALVWFDESQDPPWSFIYAGTCERDMARWLADRLSLSAPDVAAQLQKRPPALPGDGAHVFPLPDAASISGMWIIWPSPDRLVSGGEEQMIVTRLQALLEVERKERLLYGKHHPLDSEFVKAFRNDDQHALPALLSLIQTAGKADLVYWGNIDRNHVDITCHLGTKHREFGFHLPVGEGLGGKAALLKNPLHVSDYRNSAYRFPIVSHAVDREGVRSVIAIPIAGKQSETSGVLYATRREIRPFSMAERFMLSRLIRPIETMAGESPSRFYMGSGKAPPIQQKKAELRKLLQQAKHITALEAWLASLIKGRVIIVDAQGDPYGAHAMEEMPLEAAQKIPFDCPNASEHGFIYLWPDVDLPLTGWPDLFDDVVSACQIILERQSRTRPAHEHERAQWVGALIHEKPEPRHYYDGLRLGLPVDRGEIWMVAWKIEDNAKLLRARLRLEEAVLTLTKSPMILLKTRAVIFIDAGKDPSPPDALRDELLKTLPVPTWVVHGAGYNTFAELKPALQRISDVTGRARSSSREPYVLDVNGCGIDSLLSKPDLREELVTFTYRLLEPVMAYDRENGTPFTKTFALALILGKPEEAAKRLFVHPNTVHYRVKRAKQILPIDAETAGNDIALKLAAYIWLRQHDPDLLMPPRSAEKRTFKG